MPIPLDRHRHAATLEVERHLVELLVLVRPLGQPGRIRVVQYGDVQQVLEPGLVEAVEIGVLEHFLAVVTQQVDMLFQDDAILG